MSSELVRIKFRTHFDAAHWLRDYSGKCANVHGHRWRVVVTLAGKVSAMTKTGLLVDFGQLKNIINDILPDHQCLNQVKPFSPSEGNINPTAENISIVLFHTIVDRLLFFNVLVEEVEVFESDNASAIYRGGK